MNEQLKGKTILIGKEPGQGRLLVCVYHNGQPKTAAIGQPGSVPASVSRCKAAEGVAHCKIEIDAAGNMLLTNLKSQNVTYVNGSEIESKRINENSLIALGKDKYALNLHTILAVAAKLVGSATPPPPQPEYSIKHLEKVWNEYENQLDALALQQRKLGLLQRVPMFFTIGAGSIGAIISKLCPDMEWVPNLTIALAGIGVLMMGYGFYRAANDKSLQQKKSIRNDFEARYVCPNPKCRHFLGEKKFSILKQDKKCFSCGCKWKEE